MKLKYWTIVFLATAAICACLFYYIKQPASDLGPVTVHHVVKESDVADSRSSPVNISAWKTYTNSQYGFSFDYPLNSYLDTTNQNRLCTNGSFNGCGVELRTTKIDELVGGVTPDGVEGKDWTANGYFIDVYYEDYEKPFNFDSWVRDDYKANVVTEYSLSVSNIKSYEFTTDDEIDGDFPIVVVPYKNKLFIISLLSNKGPNDIEGVSIYSRVLTSFKFTN
jgi:hypothetical protein